MNASITAGPPVSLQVWCSDNQQGSGLPESAESRVLRLQGKPVGTGHWPVSGGPRDLDNIARAVGHGS